MPTIVHLQLIAQYYLLNEIPSYSLPNVSTMGSFLMMAFRLAMRITPIANVTVTTIGKPSGIAATARLQHNMNMISVGKYYYKSQITNHCVTYTKKKYQLVGIEEVLYIKSQIPENSLSNGVGESLTVTVA